MSHQYRHPATGAVPVTQAMLDEARTAALADDESRRRHREATRVQDRITWRRFGFVAGVIALQVREKRFTILEGVDHGREEGGAAIGEVHEGEPLEADALERREPDSDGCFAHV